MKKKGSLKKIILIACISAAGLILVSAYPSYILARYFFNRYFETWGDRLVSLEERRLLSREFGAAWKDVIADEAMEREADRIIEDKSQIGGDSVSIVDGVAVRDYPSLSIIRRLNEIQEYSNTIEITDRKGREIAVIRTNHRRGKIGEFPPVLIKALVAAEDANFYSNNLGFEFNSYVRAFIRAVFNSIKSLRLSKPRGTSTITQQVAKLFISDVDEEGRRIVSGTVDRKIREMRISAALRKIYKPEEILEVYLNHCVTSDYGLIGYKDISNGLLNKSLSDLSDAECVYLARMVKWGRNIHARISRQCRLDMPRIAEDMGWGRDKQAEVLAEIDTLSFFKPKQIQTQYGQLVDLANEFWLKILRKTQKDYEDYSSMDIINPNSLIRNKGNLKIKLTIDLPLQKELERLVKNRGYGQDTVIVTDVRIGSFGEDVSLNKKPQDTLRMLSVIDTLQKFSEPGSEFITSLMPGDTLVTNIRYAKTGPGKWRRSRYYYSRRPIKVDGQYFAYCILDSKTGKMLAYYSRDRIGSRLACLLQNRVPNGSSTAKPIFNALNFDLGIFQPYSKWSDSLPVDEDVPWKRKIEKRVGKPGWEVVFEHSSVRGRGYRMNNHEYVLDGCQYVFDHLAASNNILGVETVYRLNCSLFDDAGRPLKEAFGLSQFFYRIGAFNRIKNELKLKAVTGVRVYKELARIVGVDVDSMVSYGKRVPVSDSLYSVGLGTLELTLLEQAHLYNMLYGNSLIENPAGHPGLFIDTIVLNEMGIDLGEVDTVRRCHPFSDPNNLRPTYLGMHKRLVSNIWDGLVEYDIPYTEEKVADFYISDEYNPDMFALREPLSNYAKSGTTDDMLRPFNVDVTSGERTNYGQWNAVIRVDLAKLDGGGEPEVMDITIACIGECNTHYTGARDGKSLHKYVSRDLLKRAGTPSREGFFKKYEDYIRRVTPEDDMECGPVERLSDINEKKDRKGFFGLFRRKKRDSLFIDTL